MAKGQIAKDNIVAVIQTAFGEDWIGEVDKKYYVWSEENGERVQVAISLTCPKTPVAAPGNAAVARFVDAQGQAMLDFETEVSGSQAPAPAAEITDEERQNIASLLQKLGL